MKSILRDSVTPYSIRTNDAIVLGRSPATFARVGPYFRPPASLQSTNRRTCIIAYISIMSSNVGLTTPRGSGTSGYVQRNLSHLRPRDAFAPYPKDFESIKHRQRKPDQEILNHDRLREIEVQVFDLRDKLEDDGYFLSLASPFCHF